MNIKWALILGVLLVPVVIILGNNCGDISLNGEQPFDGSSVFPLQPPQQPLLPGPPIDPPVNPTFIPVPPGFPIASPVEETGMDCTECVNRPADVGTNESAFNGRTGLHDSVDVPPKTVVEFVFDVNAPVVDPNRKIKAIQIKWGDYLKEVAGAVEVTGFQLFPPYTQTISSTGSSGSVSFRRYGWRDRPDCPECVKRGRYAIRIKGVADYVKKENSTKFWFGWRVFYDGEEVPENTVTDR